MSNKKFFTLVSCMAVFFAALFSSGCGGNGGFLSNNIPPSPSGFFTVIFDSTGGSEVANQTVKSGDCAVEPDVPSNGELYFLGWYLSEGYSRMFNFNTPISQDLILYAKWFDSGDTQDTDEDKLSDSLEITFGTDPENPDTDEDGLTDYDELNWLDYNPLVPDTDNNGINDGDEDPDDDGLTNIEEGNYNTSMIIDDSDYDGLSDYDEIMIYHTDPLNPDTDGDGVKDGLEVMLGSDPVTHETSFTTSAASHMTKSHDWAIDISVTMNSSAEGAGTLDVSHANYGDSPFITRSIPGNLGAVYKITSSGDINSAEIKFTLGKAAGDFSEKFQPRIYYLDEETGRLEELENQEVSTTDRTIKAKVSHFSIYLLLNKVDFDAVWEYSIIPSVSEDNRAGIDVVFALDASGSMEKNDPQHLAITLANNFIDRLRNGKDRASTIVFDRSSWGHITELVNATESLKNSMKELIDDAIIYKHQYHGNKAFEKALPIVLNLFKQYSKFEHKYLVLFTDGENPDGDTYFYETFIQEAINNKIVIYVIEFGNSATTKLFQDMASRTKGKYYRVASDGSTEEVQLDDIFANNELVDVTTDSNNDGIPDYYLSYIDNGTIKISNGTMSLAGVLSTLKEWGLTSDDDDWDSDGLKNGEEIEIREDDNKTPYIFMKSDPLLTDTDFDGIDDYKEVKELKTSPLKKTIRINIRNAADDEYFSEQYVRKYLQFSTSPAEVFPIDVTKVQTAEKLLIDYFTTYTTGEIISRDAEAAANVQYLQNWIDGLDIGTNILGCVSSFIALKSDIESGKYTKEKLDEASLKTYEESLTLGNKIALSYSKALGNDNKTLNNIALKVTDSAMAFKYYDVIGKTSYISKAASDTDSLITALQNNIEKLAKGNFWDTAKGGTKIANKLLSYANTLNILRGKLFNIELPFKSEWGEAMNKTVHTFKNGKKLTRANVVGTVFTVVTDLTTTASDILKVYQTYGKIEANYAEFVKYIDILYYIACDADSPQYLRDAANNLASRMRNGSPDWDSFNDRCKFFAVQEGVMGGINLFLDVALSIVGKIHPAVAIGATIAKVVWKFSGVEQKHEAIIKAQTYYGITKFSKSLLGRAAYGAYIDEENSEFHYTDKYAVQLVHGRIVGLNSMMEYLLEWNIASLFDRGGLLIFEADKIKEEYTAKIKEVYETAKNAFLELSDKLPMYEEFGK